LLEVTQHPCVRHHFGSSIATYEVVLRITIQNEADKVTLKLEGRISGPWTAELNRAWHSLDPSLERKKLSVDLCGVTYIDREGRGILAEIYRRTHARFEADTPLTRYFAEEAQSSNGNGNGNGNEKGASK
jgi:ABC-type transporter Mla MlaB component